jgi:L-malate glycosyltransferase
MQDPAYNSSAGEPLNQDLNLFSPNPIRIAFILHVMQVAGAEVLVSETIRSLGEMIDPIVLCLDGVGQLGERMRSEGVPVISLNRRPGIDFSMFKRLASAIDDHGSEIVHAHQYTPFFYASIAKLYSSGRYHLMFTEHGRHYPDIVSKRRRFANSWILSRLADEINAVCRFSADALAQKDGFPGKRIEVIENGIDERRYGGYSDKAALRLQLGLNPERRYISCIARFHPVKDHKTLIRAYAGIASEHPDVDLLLVGDGPLREVCERDATAMNLTSRIRFLGVRKDVPDLLSASDLFALTSVSEAASITLLEAMASSLPVVVTKVGGNSEIVRHGQDGLLVPRGDSTAIAEAFKRLLSNPDLARRMGENSRIRVMEHYRLERTIHLYYERYFAAAAMIRNRSSQS